MHFHVSPHDGIPIYQQIVRQFKYMAASGGIVKGERLPSVRKLAETLLVNPNTVARAYRELEAEGYVISRQGAGVFASNAASPMNKRQQRKILSDRADMLLAEARQMGFDVESLCELIRRRSELLFQASEKPVSISEEVKP